MSLLTLALGPNLTLIGDLQAETWPLYKKNWSAAMIDALAQCDFRVERYPYGSVSDPTVRFLIGESHWSRKLAVHPGDPAGIVYILKDDGGGWTNGEGSFDLKPITAAVAITLGELVKEGYSGVKRLLEAGQHHNDRLAYPSERPSPTAQA